MTMELEQDYAVGSIIAIEDQLAQKKRELVEAKNHNKFMKEDLQHKNSVLGDIDRSEHFANRIHQLNEQIAQAQSLYRKIRDQNEDSQKITINQHD